MKTQKMKKIEEGIELISTGLLYLDQNKDTLEALGGSAVVDVAARLNAQYGTLEKMVSPLKANIKAFAITGNCKTVTGGAYEANIKRVVKTVLDTDAVKKFLAKKLPMFMKNREEIQISFDVKA